MCTIVTDSATIVLSFELPDLIGDTLEAAMARDEKKDLSAAEWKIMKIAWELRKAMAREIYTIAGRDHSWSPATVKTLLRRLVDKGYLRTTKVGNGFIYRPAESALTSLRSAADTLLVNAANGTTAPLLAHMVEQTALSEDDLDSLQRLIDEKKRALRKEKASSPSNQKNAIESGRRSKP